MRKETEQPARRTLLLDWSKWGDAPEHNESGTVSDVVLVRLCESHIAAALMLGPDDAATLQRLCVAVALLPPHALAYLREAVSGATREGCVVDLSDIFSAERLGFTVARVADLIKRSATAAMALEKQAATTSSAQGQ